MAKQKIYDTDVTADMPDVDWREVLEDEEDTEDEEVETNPLLIEILGYDPKELFDDADN